MMSFLQLLLLSAPKIVKRRDWKAPELVARDDSTFRRLIRDVRVVNSEAECDSKVSARVILRNLKFNPAGFAGIVLSAR